MDFYNTEEVLYRIDALDQNGLELAGLGKDKSHKFIVRTKNQTDPTKELRLANTERIAGFTGTTNEDKQISSLYAVIIKPNELLAMASQAAAQPQLVPEHSEI